MNAESEFFFETLRRQRLLSAFSALDEHDQLDVILLAEALAFASTMAANQKARARELSRNGTRVRRGPKFQIPGRERDALPAGTSGRHTTSASR
jgi:hypothetical protein